MRPRSKLLFKGGRLGVERGWMRRMNEKDRIEERGNMNGR